VELRVWVRHKLQVPALQRRYAEWEIVGRRRSGTSRRAHRTFQPVQGASAGARLHRADGALYALTQRKPGIVHLSENAGVGIARGEKHCNDQKYGN
jgi:hypothetical protein